MHNIENVACSIQRSTIWGEGNDITILFHFSHFQNQCQSFNHVHTFLPVSIVTPKAPLQLSNISWGGVMCRYFNYKPILRVKRNANFWRVAHILVVELAGRLWITPVALTGYSDWL